MELFSSIASPTFSELVLVIWYDQFALFPSQVALLEDLRTMNKLRPFKLEFLVRVWMQEVEEMERKRFERAVELVITGDLLNFLEFPPTVRVV